MFSKLMTWLSLKEAVVPIPEDIFNRINHYLGALTDERLARYDVRKSLSIRVTMSSPDPEVLTGWLRSSSRIVDKAEYVEDVWKTSVRIEDTLTLDNYLTHNTFDVSAAQWLTVNKPRIQRLLNGFERLEEDDHEYYQRNYNSVLRDLDSLLGGILNACS